MKAMKEEARGARQLESRSPRAGGENGNWKCPHGANVNFATRDNCNRCGMPKPKSEAGEELSSNAHINARRRLHDRCMLLQHVCRYIM